MKQSFLLIAVIALLMAPLAAQSVKVVSPNGGESWALHSSFPITWTSANAGAVKVDIILRKGSVRVGAIKSQVSLAAGSCPWQDVGKLEDGTVVDAGTDYVIRIRDAANTFGDSSDNAFAITTGTGPVIIKAPPYERVPPSIFQKPKLVVSDIDLTPNAEGFGIIFSYKNVGNGPLPKASQVPVKPSYRVLIDGREMASGSLFIPAFSAPPGWEQMGYFGGMIVMPANLYENKLWNIGNTITVHINENKVMGMENHTLGLNLKPIALKYAYDVVFTEVTFDWNTNELRMSVRVDGKVPPGKKLRFHCPGEFYHDVELHSGQNGYSYAQKLIYKVPKGQNLTMINALAYLVPLPSGGEKLLDIDLRNNQGLFRFERPPRPAESPK